MHGSESNWPEYLVYNLAYPVDRMPPSTNSMHSKIPEYQIKD